MVRIICTYPETRVTYNQYVTRCLLVSGLQKIVNMLILNSMNCPLPHRVVLLSNGTLLITHVKPRNTGTYKCVGHGLKGSRVTLEASLLIAGTRAHTQRHTHL